MKYCPKASSISGRGIILMLLALILGQVILLGGTRLEAHAVDHEKVIEAALAPDGLHLTITQYVPAGARAEKMRNRFNRNWDTFLTDKEREALENALAGQALRTLTIRFDDQPIKFRKARISSSNLRDLLPSDRLISITVILTHPVNLQDGKEHRLAIADQGSLGSGHVPLELQFQSPVMLISTNQGKFDQTGRRLSDVTLQKQKNFECRFLLTSQPIK